jgi:hypothetical protein
MRSAAAVSAICALGFSISELGGHDASALLVSIPFATLTSFVLGWPLALVLGAPIAILFSKELQEKRLRARIFTVTYATLVGAVGVPLVWASFEEPDPHSIMQMTGIVAGLVAGALFCRLMAKGPLRR